MELGLVYIFPIIVHFRFFEGITAAVSQFWQFSTQFCNHFAKISMIWKNILITIQLLRMYFQYSIQKKWKNNKEGSLTKFFFSLKRVVFFPDVATQDFDTIFGKFGIGCTFNPFWSDLEHVLYSKTLQRAASPWSFEYALELYSIHRIGSVFESTFLFNKVHQKSSLSTN